MHGKTVAGVLILTMAFFLLLHSPGRGSDSLPQLSPEIVKEKPGSNGRMGYFMGCSLG
jgi:hypothetical protein